MPRFSLEDLRKYNHWIAITLSFLIIVLMLLLTFLNVGPTIAGF